MITKSTFFFKLPRHPENDPRNIGEADLNPLAQGGGGMIYDPFSPARRNPFNPLRPALGVPGRLPPYVNKNKCIIFNL